MTAHEMRERILKEYPHSGPLAVEWAEGVVACKDEGGPDCRCGRRIERILLHPGTEHLERGSVVDMALTLIDEMRRG